MASCVRPAPAVPLPAPSMPHPPLLLLLLAPIRIVGSVCDPVPEPAGHLGGRLGPGQASWFGPALNLLPLLRVQATEAEGAEGVMAPEKHPGKRQERKGAAESPPQGHARLRHLQPGTF